VLLEVKRRETCVRGDTSGNVNKPDDGRDRRGLQRFTMFIRIAIRSRSIRARTSTRAREQVDNAGRLLEVNAESDRARRVWTRPRQREPDGARLDLVDELAVVRAYDEGDYPGPRPRFRAVSDDRGSMRSTPARRRFTALRGVLRGAESSRSRRRC